MSANIYHHVTCTTYSSTLTVFVCEESSATGLFCSNSFQLNADGDSTLTIASRSWGPSFPNPTIRESWVFFQSWSVVECCTFPSLPIHQLLDVSLWQLCFKGFKDHKESFALAVSWSEGQLTLTVDCCLLPTSETCAGIRGPFWRPRWTTSECCSGSSRESRSWTAGRGSWSTLTAICCFVSRSVGWFLAVMSCLDALEPSLHLTPSWEAALLIHHDAVVTEHACCKSGSEKTRSAGGARH